MRAYGWGFKTYTKVWVTVLEDLSASLAADVLGNFLELSSCAGLLDVDGLQSDLVREQSRRVLPASEYESSVGLLRIDNGLLDVLVDGRLDCAHEARAHVDTASAKGKSSSQSLAVCKPS